ncbi:hypothetical protein EYC80_010394 [Monilinia laxa]|uniref:Uncharacterized protein n=1 Tax=Monilinia laxa TaxID=61186 RepID=A0A5N6JP92_MONLA|nr:hypothetical protein EYC80_010394 [Monilinia laxa]
MLRVKPGGHYIFSNIMRGSKTATSPVTCEGSEPKEAGFIEVRRIITVTWASFHQTVAAARTLEISEV